MDLTTKMTEMTKVIKRQSDKIDDLQMKLSYAIKNNVDLSKCKMESSRVINEISK
jgi:hypothetical protein